MAEPQPTNDNTVQSLAETYNECHDLWYSSAQYVETQSLFKRTILPMENIKVINRAVCLGLGSFCQENEFCYGDGGSLTIQDSERRYALQYPRGLTTMTQFIAFEYWLELLGTRADIKEVVFQDPAFNEVDVEFLDGRGFSTIWDKGEAEESMTVETFLFAPVGGWRHIIENCLYVAHPCLMISHSIEPVRHTFGHPEDRYNLEDDAPERREAELERRSIVRPYQRTHIARPAWRFTDAMPILEYSQPDSILDWFYALRHGNWRPNYKPVDNRSQLAKSFADGLANRQVLDLPPPLVWCRELWIYWRPDNKGRLWLQKKVGDEDDLPQCTCFDCMKRVAWSDMHLSRERTPSPIEMELQGIDGPEFDQEYAEEVAANNQDEEILAQSPVELEKPLPQKISFSFGEGLFKSFFGENAPKSASTDSSLTTLGSTPTTPGSPSFAKFSRPYKPATDPTQTEAGKPATPPDSPTWRRFIPANEPSPEISPKNKTQADDGFDDAVEEDDYGDDFATSAPPKPKPKSKTTPKSKLKSKSKINKTSSPKTNPDLETQGPYSRTRSKTRIAKKRISYNLDSNDFDNFNDFNDPNDPNDFNFNFNLNTTTKTKNSPYPYRYPPTPYPFFYPPYSYPPPTRLESSSLNITPLMILLGTAIAISMWLTGYSDLQCAGGAGGVVVIVGLVGVWVGFLLGGWSWELS